MPTWLISLIAVLAAITASVIASVISARRTKHHLRALFAGRDSEKAVSSCVAAFAGTDERRVRLAYQWVQMLVNATSPPIQPEDDLWVDLRIDQGDADDLFESSHEWRGERAEEDSKQVAGSPTTVKELMAEVLAFQYEGYVEVPHRSALQNAG